MTLHSLLAEELAEVKAERERLQERCRNLDDKAKDYADRMCRAEAERDRLREELDAATSALDDCIEQRNQALFDLSLRGQERDRLREALASEKPVLVRGDRVRSEVENGTARYEVYVRPCDVFDVIAVETKEASHG